MEVLRKHGLIKLQDLNQTGAMKIFIVFLMIFFLPEIRVMKVVISAGLSVNGLDKSLIPLTDSEHRVKSNGRLSETKPLYLDEKSDSVGENAGGDDSLFDNCGILPSNCLPCLISSVPSEGKRRSLSSSPPNTRKKAMLKLSFKWREGHPTANLHSFEQESKKRRGYRLYSDSP